MSKSSLLSPLVMGEDLFFWYCSYTQGVADFLPFHIGAVASAVGWVPLVASLLLLSLSSRVSPGWFLPTLLVVEVVEGCASVVVDVAAPSSTSVCVFPTHSPPTTMALSVNWACGSSLRKSDIVNDQFARAAPSLSGECTL